LSPLVHRFDTLEQQRQHEIARKAVLDKSPPKAGNSPRPRPVGVSPREVEATAESAAKDMILEAAAIADASDAPAAPPRGAPPRGALPTPVADRRIEFVCPPGASAGKDPCRY